MTDILAIYTYIYCNLEITHGCTTDGLAIYIYIYIYIVTNLGNE